jgi:hypothetical protein
MTKIIFNIPRELSIRETQLLLQKLAVSLTLKSFKEVTIDGIVFDLTKFRDKRFPDIEGEKLF